MVPDPSMENWIPEMNWFTTSGCLLYNMEMVSCTASSVRLARGKERKMENIPNVMQSLRFPWEVSG